MKRVQNCLAAAVAITALALAAGCGGSVGEASSAPQATAQAQTVEGAGGDVARTHEAHGPMQAIQRALTEVNVRADQKATIDQLFADAKARQEKAFADGASARKDLVTALASQVEAGNVDVTALQPKIDAVQAVHAQARAADLAALDKLHATLDASQRNALVDALEKNAPAGHQWKKGGEHEGAKKEHGMHGGFFKDLNLTDDQKAKIHDAFAAQKKGDEIREHAKDHVGIKEALDAFRGDAFSAATAMPQRPEMHDRVDHMVRFFSIATPILTQEQRTQAAADLRAKAAK